MADVTFFHGWFTSLSDAEMETTARHELGHVLSFEHSTDPKCLMYFDILPTMNPKPACPAELKLLRETYHD